MDMQEVRRTTEALVMPLLSTYHFLQLVPVQLGQLSCSFDADLLKSHPLVEDSLRETKRAAIATEPNGRVHFAPLQTQDFPIASRTIQLKTSAGGSFTAVQIGQVSGVRVKGREVVAALVTAAHCVLEEWEGAELQITPAEPFAGIEILTVPNVQTMVEDPISGNSVLLERPLALLIGYGSTALPPSRPLWSSSISPMFSCALVGTPHYDLPIHHFPACIRHSIDTQTGISRQLNHEVYQNYGKKLVGRGVAVHRKGILAAYISASIGMSGAPLYEVKDGVNHLVGVLICGPLSQEYATLLSIVRAVSEGDFPTASAHLLELRQLSPKLTTTLPPLLSKLTQSKVLRRLNTAIPRLLSRSTSSGYNLGISVDSSAFRLIRERSDRLCEMRGDFHSVTSLLAALHSSS